MWEDKQKGHDMLRRDWTTCSKIVNCFGSIPSQESKFYHNWGHPHDYSRRQEIFTYTVSGTFIWASKIWGNGYNLDLNFLINFILIVCLAS